MYLLVVAVLFLLLVQLTKAIEQTIATRLSTPGFCLTAVSAWMGGTRSVPSAAAERGLTTGT